MPWQRYKNPACFCFYGILGARLPVNRQGRCTACSCPVLQLFLNTGLQSFLRSLACRLRKIAAAQGRLPASHLARNFLHRETFSKKKAVFPGRKYGWQTGSVLSLLVFIKYIQYDTECDGNARHHGQTKAWSVDISKNPYQRRHKCSV